MTRNQIIATWLSFTISTLRRAAGLSVAQFVRLDRQYGLIHFLAENYELLHYYDTDYVIDDVKSYLAERGGSVHAAS